MIDLPHNNSQTSRDAADSIAHAIESQMVLVREAIAAAGELGMTRPELCAVLDLPGDSVRPRCWQLMRDGLVRDSGRTRVTPRGRKAEVLVIA